MKKTKQVEMLGSNPNSEVVCLKIKGGREVRFFVRSYLQILESVRKKTKEVGRLRSNPDSEVVCLKIKGGREVRFFVRSYLQFLESARKNPRR